MCGISGSIGFDPQTQQNLVERIVKSQLQRGPDFQAVLGLPCHALLSVVLGHNRLSIIDTTAASNQPMWNRDQTCCLTYNGEVYNYIELREELKGLGYTFSTTGDVEVLMTAYVHWGLDFANRLNGMFALAIFDQRANRLVLVRDRFGVKPLYFVANDDQVSFASTPTVLAQHYKCPPNLRYVQQGLTYRVYEDDSEQSPYVGVRSLSGGTMAVITVEGSRLKLEQRRYYDLSANIPGKVEEISGLNDGQQIELLLETLRSAAAIRMRSDVPVALSVSGGLDSSSIAVLLAEAGQKPCGYTFGDPNDPRSEGPAVKQVADFSRYHVNYVRAGLADYEDALDTVFEGQDAPFMTASIMAQYFVYKAAKRDGVKVLLGGQGGDESLMGYRKYLLFAWKQLVNDRDLVGAARHLVQSVPTIMGEMGGLPKYLGRRKAYASGGDAASDAKVLLDTEATVLTLGFDKNEPLWKRQAADILRFSLPTLLRYEDRNSMSQSIESRLPYMDYRLVELGLALRTGLKVSHGFGKYAMRVALKDHMPDSIRLMRRKFGFEVELGEVMKQGLGAKIRGRLRDVESDYRPILRAPVDIEEAFSDQALLSRSKAFGEAMSLLWLGKRLSGK